MDKKKIPKRREVSSQKPKKELKLENFGRARKLNPLKELTNVQQASAAVFECLLNNDPEGAMEMIEIYLDALNKAKMSRDKKLPKSTMYSALKHRNPTIKTLAKMISKAA